MQLAEEKYENIDVPGVGEVRGRVGTSTIELAGAVKFWHDKAKTAYVDGFATGSLIGVVCSALVVAVFFLLR